MASKLNGLDCLGYRETQDGFEAILQNATKEEIISIDPVSLDIAAEDGHVVESYRGFGPARKITEDLALKQFTVLFPWEDDTAQRVTLAESQLREQASTTGALVDENRKLKAQLEAAQVSSQMLEDCVVEMAGVVYA